MARLPRVILAGYPLHIMVRGHNSQEIFISDDEKKSYLNWLRDASRQYDLAIHAFVLMPSHVNILATPKTSLSASRVMQSVGRRYAQMFNQMHDRTGTVWEGRFKSALIEPEPYLLLCQKYIEQSPVRAGLVSDSEQWPWSSYRHHIGAETIPWVADHPLYWALGNTPFERHLSWQKSMAEQINKKDQSKVSNHLSNGWPMVTNSELEAIAPKINRPLSPRRAGRPKAIKIAS